MCRMKIQSSIAVKICISKHGGVEKRKTADREGGAKSRISNHVAKGKLVSPP